MLTNEDIKSILRERHPEIKIDDYRPLCNMYIPKNNLGILFWTKNGDCFAYYPDLNTKEPEQYRKHRENIMEKLKPCPCCGAEATLIAKIYNDCFPIKRTAYVYCSECGIQTGVYTDDNNDNSHIKKAITVWNNRM